MNGLRDYKQRKVSTDMAVPDEAFPGLFRLYKDTLRSSGLRYTIFGHIGDNHVHVNILPRDDAEGARARELYVQFLEVCRISRRHTLSRARRRQTKTRVPAPFLHRRPTSRDGGTKKALDPNGILGRGNIFSEDLLNSFS